LPPRRRNDLFLKKKNFGKKKKDRLMWSLVATLARWLALDNVNLVVTFFSFSFCCTVEWQAVSRVDI
jgi:hypothetical protein